MEFRNLITFMKRIAAYCRVSTDKTDQANSFENQQHYFRNYIQQHPNWELFALYTDEGISGTSTYKRYGFNQMISDAKNNCFDYILTKEVSRFARNTVDTLQYTRELKQLGIGVYFTIDQIDTLSPDAELRLTIMASLAQEESRKTSERVKWGQKRRMEQGIVFGRDLLGYHVQNGTLYLKEEEALIVRSIFYKFLIEGKSTSAIAHELTENNIPLPSHMTKWSSTAISRILQNEKYCGDLIQKKTFTPDYLSHQKKHNQGEEPLIVLHNHHTPIISHAQFKQAQQELKRRTPSSKNPSRYSNQYCLSGKIFCSSCGSHFVSRTRHRKDGSLYCAWRCYTATHTKTSKNNLTTSCHSNCGISSQIPNEVFFAMLQQIFYQLFFTSAADIFTELESTITSVLTYENPLSLKKDLKQQQENLQKKQERLLELLIDGILTKETYSIAKEKCSKETSLLEKKLSKINNQSFSSQTQKQISDNLDYLKSILSNSIIDENFSQFMLHKIIVSSLDQIEVFLYGFTKPWVFRLTADES